MPRNSTSPLQFLTFCMLIGLTYAIIGEKVRIVQEDECPYVVSISHKPKYDSGHGNLHFCTGTLIKRRSVLTAAHCLRNKKPSDVEIIAGSKDLLVGKRYFPESWITYDQWKITHKNNHLSSNDIAVIILQGQGIHGITPVRVLMIPDQYLDNQDVKILGWANLTNGQQPFQLRTAILKVLSNEQCSAAGTKLKGNHFSVPTNFFCSKAEPYVVSTRGDGGGPIIYKRDNLVGINIGVCPKIEGNYSSEYLNQNLLNSHLHITPYQEFLVSVAK